MNPTDLALDVGSYLVIGIAQTALALRVAYRAGHPLVCHGSAAILVLTWPVLAGLVLVLAPFALLGRLAAAYAELHHKEEEIR